MWVQQNSGLLILPIDIVDGRLPAVWFSLADEQDQVVDRKEDPPACVVGIVHAADGDGEGWDKECGACKVLEQVAGCENIENRCTNIDKPGEENEVPELAASSCALDDEVLLKCGDIDIYKVLHGASLAWIVRAMNGFAHYPINYRENSHMRNCNARRVPLAIATAGAMF